MSTQDGVTVDKEKLSRRKVSTGNVCKTLKTHTKYARIVCGRPTLKYVECFGTGRSVNLMRYLFIVKEFVNVYER